MSMLEIFAALFSAACVYLAIVRNVWTYPVGIIGTILYFFVFWDIKLFSSAWLQVFFTVVQVYGWWYWLRGDNGGVPRITTFGYARTAALALVVGGLSWLAGQAIAAHTAAQLASTDAMIFGLSVLAQLGLDRKKLENWSIWIVIDVISIYVYFNAGLYVTTGLYAAFLVLAIVGLFAWTKAFRLQPNSLEGWTIEEGEDYPTEHGDEMVEELSKELIAHIDSYRTDELIKRSAL